MWLHGAPDSPLAVLVNEVTPIFMKLRSLVHRRARLTTERDAPNERYSAREGGTLSYMGLATDRVGLPIVGYPFRLHF